MTRKQHGTVMERETVTAPEFQTYSISFPDHRVEIAVTGNYVEGQPIVLRAEEDCGIHFDEPVFEHDIYWLPKNRNIELLPLHNSSTFDILRPVTPITMTVNGTPIAIKDGPRIPTVSGNNPPGGTPR